MANLKKVTPSWDLVGKSISLVRSHFTPFMYLILLPGLLYSLGALLAGTLVTPEGKINLDGQQSLGLLLIGIAGLWTLVNLGPATHFELSATKHEPKLLREYYRAGLSDSLRLLGLYVVCGALIVLGFLLLIVPGFIALRMLILAPFYFIDKELSIIQAIKTSAKNSKPFSGAIWGVLGIQFAFSLAAAGITSVPVIGIIIGQMITYSIAFMLVLRYRTIEG